MKQEILLNDEVVAFELLQRGEDFVEFKLQEKVHRYSIDKFEEHIAYLSSKEGKQRVGTYQDSKNSLVVIHEGVELRVEPKGRKSSKKNKGQGSMKSPMPGKILKVLVKKGDKVEKNSPLMIIEAMKMEHTIRATGSGEITEVFYNEGDLVEGNVELVDLKES